MKININIESEDFEQLEANIVAKYAGISQKTTPKKAASREKQIQDFASDFSSLYKKFKELFIVAHHQHGMYLAFANRKPSNGTHHADDADLIKYRKEIFNLDEPLWIYLTVSIFDTLLVNLRKLTTDTSSGAGKAISMKRIKTKIRNLHISIKADSDEFTRFLECLESHIKRVESPQMQNLWDYTDRNVIHLEDKYEYDNSNSFIISDLKTLIGTVSHFIGDICNFYNYGTSGSILNVSYGNAVRWMCKLGFFIENSLGDVKDDINAIASTYCLHPDYINLTPEKASSEILKKVIPSDEFLGLRMTIAVELKQRIEELRDEFLRQNTGNIVPKS